MVTRGYEPKFTNQPNWMNLTNQKRKISSVFFNNVVKCNISFKWFSCLNSLGVSFFSISAYLGHIKTGEIYTCAQNSDLSSKSFVICRNDDNGIKNYTFRLKRL